MICQNKGTHNVGLSLLTILITVSCLVFVYYIATPTLSSSDHASPNIRQASVKVVMEMVQSYTESLSTISMAVLGAIMAALTTLAKKSVLSSTTVFLASVSLGMAASSAFFGQQTILAMIHLYSQVDTFPISHGIINWASQWQFYTLLCSLVPTLMVLLLESQALDQTGGSK